MLSLAEEHLGEMNPDARLVMFGQELNAESLALAALLRCHWNRIELRSRK